MESILVFHRFFKYFILVGEVWKLTNERYAILNPALYRKHIFVSRRIREENILDHESGA
jgi:hypothetical protein